MLGKTKLSLKMKLSLGFLLFYLISGIVPIVSTLIVQILDLGDQEALLLPLFTISGSILLCLLTGLYLWKWVSAPVHKLVVATEGIAAGNVFDADTEIHTGDEIESFARSLSRMKSSVRIALSMLGSSEDKVQGKSQNVKGLTMGKKIVLGLVLFYILNPVVVLIPILYASEDFFTSSLQSAPLFIPFSLLVMFIIVTYLNKSIMEPFAALTEAADKISKGDFDTMIEVKSSGDIGKLEANFKNITERVQMAMKELEGYD